jgi:hypothetical protein
MPITLKLASDISRAHGFGSLMTLPDANAKLAKSSEWFNAGLSFVPGDMSGHEVCPGRGNCFAIDGETVCLVSKGRGELNSVEKSRTARTKFRFEHPDLFDDVLRAELHKVDRMATRKGLPVAFRPNMFSDLSWHRSHPWLFTEFAHWAFYGYTKVRGVYREFLNGKLPGNYHLTYSYSERVTDDYCRGILSEGGTLAVVFDTDKAANLPKRFLGYDVINAVDNDLRFQDRPGVVAGLIAKTPKRKAEAIRFRRMVTRSGFFVKPSDIRCD